MKPTNHPQMFHLNFLGMPALIIGVLIFITQSVVTPNSAVPNTPIVFKQDPFQEIGLAELIVLNQKKTTLCIDIRTAEFYQYGHIPGAIEKDFASIADMTELPDSLRHSLEAAANIVLYANNDSNRLLRDTAMKISQWGISGIKIYSPGWEQWKACGMPVERSQE